MTPGFKILNSIFSLKRSKPLIWTRSSQVLLSGLLGAASISICQANPLHPAVRQGDLAKVLQIIESATRPPLSFLKRMSLNRNSDLSKIIHKKDKNGNTPLMLAVSYGHLTIFQALIQNGANLEDQDLFENTPLHRAVINDNLEMVELLIRAGARMDVENLSHLSPMALALGQNKVASLRRMLELNPDLSFRDRDQNTLLHIAAAHCNAEAVLSLIGKGLSLDARNSLGRTPLMLAITSKQDGIARLLYHTGGEGVLTVRDHTGQTPGSLAKLEGCQGLYDAVNEDLHETFTSESQFIFVLDYGPEISDPVWKRLQEQFFNLVPALSNLNILTKIRRSIKTGKFTITELQQEILDSRIREMRIHELELLAAESGVPNKIQAEAASIEATVDGPSESAAQDIAEVTSQDAAQTTAQTLITGRCSRLCSICLEDLDELNQEDLNLGPADCTCRAHLSCYRETAETAYRNAGARIARCILGCGERMTPAFLQRSGLTESEVAEFQKRQLILGLSAQPHWKFCNTPDCPNGKVLFIHDSCYFECCLCEKDGCLIPNSGLHSKDCELNSQKTLYKLSVAALKKLLTEGAKAGGKHRPCYHCGVITEKNGGCNHMTCGSPACRQNWDWNVGPYSGCPSSGDGPMQYTPRVQPHL